MLTHHDIIDATTITKSIDQALTDNDPRRDHWAARERVLQRLRLIREVRLNLDRTLKAAERTAAMDAWREGYSWTQIAHELGISRQTAQQTYRDRPTGRRASERDDASWPEALEEES